MRKLLFLGLALGAFALVTTSCEKANVSMSPDGGISAGYDNGDVTGVVKDGIGGGGSGSDDDYGYILNEGNTAKQNGHIE